MATNEKQDKGTAKLGCLIFAVLLALGTAFLMFSGDDEKKPAENPPAQTQQYGLTKEERQKASKELLAILSKMPVQEENGVRAYQSWGNKELPHRSGVQWIIARHGEEIKMIAVLVDYCPNGDLIGWDKVEFITKEHNYSYTLPNFDGKIHTEDKTFEAVGVPFGDVEGGLKVLAAGTDPVIRYIYKGQHHDHKVTAEDIKTINEGRELFDRIETLLFKLEK